MSGRRSFRLKLLALLLLLVPPAGLHLSVQWDITWLTWLFMGGITLGMLISLWTG